MTKIKFCAHGGNGQPDIDADTHLGQTFQGPAPI
jgi:hypothetical protein